MARDVVDRALLIGHAFLGPFENPGVAVAARRTFAMAGKDRLEAIDVALTNEMREHEFYLKHAGRTKNPVGRAMFQRIGAEELEHYNRLKELHAKWKKEEKWPETVPLRVQDTIVKNVLLEALNKAGKKPVTDTDDLEALRTAIDFEFKGVAFYEKLRGLVTDPREKQFFALLAGIEKEHALSLQDAELFFTDPESYFRKVEHHTLDGV
jgi:rubrerythrin